MVTKLISEIKEHGFSDPERILQLISEIDFRSVDSNLLRQMYETLEQINVRTMEISTDLQRREISYLVQQADDNYSLLELCIELERAIRDRQVYKLLPGFLDVPLGEQ